MTLAGSEKVRLYGEQAEKLLPRGRPWTIEPDSNFARLLEGLGSEFANVDERAVDLLRESDPRFSSELLPDWERVLGIPSGGCGELGDNSIQRQFQIVQKLAAQGGQSPGYFIAVADLLGFTITIEEFTPAETGVLVCGDQLNGASCSHLWVVHAQDATPFFFTAGESGAGEALYEVDVSILECTLIQLRPAHTDLKFVYDIPREGYGPWTEFYPPPTVLPLSAPIVTRLAT